MKSLKVFAMIGALFFVTAMAQAAQVKNPELRGIPQSVTVTGSTTVTNVPVEINGSALNRVGCTITNPNTSFNVRITFAATTYTAKDQISYGLCHIIPPGGSLMLHGANYSPGPWTEDWTYGKTMYADVSPTPLDVVISFDAWKFYNTPAD
jgi:hypothetical protein